MEFSLRLLLLFPLLLLAACSSSQRGDAPPPLFATHINQEGSKRFVFEAAPLERLPVRLPADGKLERPRKSLLETREAIQEEQLSQWMTEKQFCHQGFIVLTRTSWKVRGECNEGASTADRQRFPNTPQWEE
ncbi:hypothetical protein E2P79_15830 [Aeromonas schubertii]|uniref:Lipoprotein n=1 Tax=Aeromonas schubertii TaxID=652 RepID=A0A0S2SMG7_9GAMM|nr:hypothetical protein WL1483_3508 [Aeromonas schubertii]QCG49090.1 hypothetical protein E2P79_15830 [Aeromonas schubertii]